MDVEEEGGFQINTLHDEDRMTYVVMINWILLVQSLAIITYDRVPTYMPS